MLLGQAQVSAIRAVTRSVARKELYPFELSARLVWVSAEQGSRVFPFPVALAPDVSFWGAHVMLTSNGSRMYLHGDQKFTNRLGMY